MKTVSIERLVACSNWLYVAQAGRLLTIFGYPGGRSIAISAQICRLPVMAPVLRCNLA
jgi:hypothetical protein